MWERVRSFQTDETYGSLRYIYYKNDQTKDVMKSSAWLALAAARASKHQWCG